MEAIERSADVWVVIEADHHPALATTHELRHVLVLLEWEIHAISGSLPIWRVHVEKRVCSIIALGTVEPGQILDVGAGEALPRRG